MLRIERRASASSTPSDELVLIYDDRKKSRLRVQSRGGVDVAIALERGSALRDGDLLQADSGEVLRVRAAEEMLSEVRTGDARELARAAYHLGNRHVPVQVEREWLRFQHDHVLDGMIVALGSTVRVVHAAFEPEGGAYGAGHLHSHGDVEHEHAYEREREGLFEAPLAADDAQGRTPLGRVSAVDLVPEYDPEPTVPAIYLRERAQAISERPSRAPGRLSAFDEVPRHGHDHSRGDEPGLLDEHGEGHGHADDSAHERPQDFAANALAERLKRRRSSASALVPHHITLPPPAPAADSGEPKPPTGGKRS